jgi:hypothetical protein
MLVLPVVSHSPEFLLHWLRNTPHLKASVASSLCFTVFSTRRRNSPGRLARRVVHAAIPRAVQAAHPAKHVRHRRVFDLTDEGIEKSFAELWGDRFPSVVNQFVVMGLRVLSAPRLALMEKRKSPCKPIVSRRCKSADACSGCDPRFERKNRRLEKAPGKTGNDKSRRKINRKRQRRHGCQIDSPDDRYDLPHTQRCRLMQEVKTVGDLSRINQRAPA